MIKKADLSDAAVLAELAKNLWDSHSLSQLEEEFDELLKNEAAVCFIKYDGAEPAGFAQCQLRNDYVEGTGTSPVGYLEGIFVAERYRHKGYAIALLNACEKWAKEKGCTEFASDCELDNQESFRFHIASGFEETNRIICFKKSI